MTEHSQAFRGQYKKLYGRENSGPGVCPPDLSRCAALVVPNDRVGMFFVHQCKLKNGHGPEGAWCRRHDPVAIEAKRQAERKAADDKWNLYTIRRDLEAERLTIIKAIADGHNDPRSLCVEYLGRLEASENFSIEVRG